MSSILNENLIDYLNNHDIKPIERYAEIVYVEWNGLTIILDSTLEFLDFTDLCTTFKTSKTKTGKSSWKSLFHTHFEKSCFYKRHPELFKDIDGHKFIHKSLIQSACHGIANGIGDEWFLGFPINLDSSGEGWIYLIYIPGLDCFKFGKADDSSTRFTNYIGELNKHDKKVAEKGIVILLVLKVRNMSFSEDTIGKAFDEAKFEKRNNTSEYYHVPLDEGESESDRANYVKDIVIDAISDEDMDLDWDKDGNCKEYELYENHKLRKK